MVALSRSPLAPELPEDLPAVAGVRLASGSFGLRYQDRPDVFLACFDDSTVGAGVFATSSTAAAPISWCRNALRKANPRALVVNAGQANSFVGDLAEQLIDATADAIAGLCQCDREQMLMASTGVIGEPVPRERLIEALPTLYAQLGDRGWAQAATAIGTTDTFPKYLSKQVQVEGVTVTINGIAKGSGMIAPNMATMLAFIFTDANITQDALQQLLSDTADKSFNCISVDGDASTNDTLLAFATCRAEHPRIEHITAPEHHAFRLAFEELMVELAQMVVRDGEGAQKFITVHVNGAETQAAAHRIAMDIVSSPLVKTAVAGEDPNWGRIVMAVGKSGQAVDATHLSIAFGEHIIARNGAAVPGFDEAPVAQYMKGREIDITVEVGHEPGEAKVWGCDLTHQYIDINADYRS